MLCFNSDKYSSIEMIIKALPDCEGFVSLSLKDKNHMIVQKAGKFNYKFVKFSLEKNSDYILAVENCSISFAYLCGNDDIFDDGVCFVEIGDTFKLYPKNHLKEYYDAPYREQFHFAPFKNWNNDPCGLCFYKGYYHMFYQTNPNEQKWDNMYWGHAVSKDLIHWVHLPFAFYPQDELLDLPELKGGAYTGSSIIKDDKMELYFTRHLGFPEDENGTLQYQVYSESKDGISFAKDKVVIIKNKEMSYNFRDPKVQKINEEIYIVIGSKYHDTPCILLYKLGEANKWEFVGPLLYDSEATIETIECPDFFKLGDKYVAVGSLMKHKDNYGRVQSTRYYIGDFDGKELKVESKGLYDFGTDFYAVQSFEHKDRRIAIGWISDFYGEHIATTNGAYGSMTIPRELSVKNNLLYMKPIEEVYSLIKDKVIQAKEENIIAKNISGNSYYAKLELNDIQGELVDNDFEIIVGEDNNKAISLIRNSNTFEIKISGTKSESVKFVTEITKVEKIEVFVDRRVVEVFINDGEKAGCKLFYNSNQAGLFKTNFNNPKTIKEIQVFTMKSIW